MINRYYDDFLFDVSELEMAARGRYPWSLADLTADLYDFSETAVSRRFGALDYRFVIYLDGRNPIYTIANGKRAMCMIYARADNIDAPETWGKIIMRVLPSGIDVKIYCDPDGLGADGLREYISELVKYLTENDFEPDTAVTTQAGGDGAAAVNVQDIPGDVARLAAAGKRWGARPESVELWERIAELKSVPLTNAQIIERIPLLTDSNFKYHWRKMRDSGFWDEWQEPPP